MAVDNPTFGSGYHDAVAGDLTEQDRIGASLERLIGPLDEPIVAESPWGQDALMDLVELLAALQEEGTVDSSLAPGEAPSQESEATGTEEPSEDEDGEPVAEDDADEASSPEELAGEPGAGSNGPQGSGGPDAGGSSQAVQSFADSGLGKDFGQSADGSGVEGEGGEELTPPIADPSLSLLNQDDPSLDILDLLARQEDDLPPTGPGTTEENPEEEDPEERGENPPAETPVAALAGDLVPSDESLESMVVA